MKKMKKVYLGDELEACFKESLNDTIKALIVFRDKNTKYGNIKIDLDFYECLAIGEREETNIEKENRLKKESDKQKLQENTEKRKLASLSQKYPEEFISLVKQTDPKLVSESIDVEMREQIIKFKQEKQELEAKLAQIRKTVS